MRLLSLPRIAACLAAAAILPAATAGPASATVSDATLAAQATTAKQTSRTSHAQITRFDGGYYDAVTDEVYIDQGARVAHLVGGKLVDEKPVKSADPKTSFLTSRAAASAPSICSDTTNLTHCETITCQNTSFWLQYSNDRFSYAAFGENTFHNGTYVNVRNADGHGYRLVPPRGVRGYFNDHWGFYSSNCVSGGNYN